MVFRKRINPKLKAFAFFLKETGILFSERSGNLPEIKVFGNPICQKLLNEQECTREKKSPGRPRKLDTRTRRQLFRSFENLQAVDCNFSVKQLVNYSGLDLKKASYRTYVRCLHEEVYGSRQTRKKGLLSSKDRMERLKFARKWQKFLKAQPIFFFSGHKILFRWCFVCLQNKPLWPGYKTKGTHLE